MANQSPSDLSVRNIEAERQRTCMVCIVIPCGFKFQSDWRTEREGYRCRPRCLRLSRQCLLLSRQRFGDIDEVIADTPVRGDRSIIGYHCAGLDLLLGNLGK